MDEITVLRLRAASLRSLATRLGCSTALDAPPRASADVWIGPTAERWRESLASLCRRLAAEPAKLRYLAAALDREADELHAALLAAAASA